MAVAPTVPAQPTPSNQDAPLAVAVRGRVEAGDVSVSDLSYVLPSGRRVAAYGVWRPVDQSSPGPGVVLAHWGRVDGRRVLLNEAIELARLGHRVVVPETPRPDGTDTNALTRSLGDAVATQRRALDVLVHVARADADRLGLVGHEGGALPALMTAAADPRVRGLVLDGYGGVGRLTQVDANGYVARGPYRRLMVQHRDSGSDSGSDSSSDSGGDPGDARRLFEAAARPREWRAYAGGDAAVVQVAADRARFLDRALRAESPNGAGASVRRGLRHVRDPDWWLRDRSTGERSLTPEATTPMLLWQLLEAAHLLGLAPGHERALRRSAIAVSSVWALDEVVRGANPARRALGAGVLGAQALRTGWVARTSHPGTLRRGKLRRGKLRRRMLLRT